MAETLAEQFLADLDELSDEEPEHLNTDDAEDMEEEVVDDLEALNYDDLRSVAKLQADASYQDIMQGANCSSLCCRG